MIATRADDITAAVLAEAGRTPDARQRELLLAAVRHLHAFAREVRTLPVPLRRSLTYDQGQEMREHRLFTKETKMLVYFAHP